MHDRIETTTSASYPFFLIAVPVFLNRTPYPTVEQIFTEKVRVEFQSRGRYTVKPTEEGADAVVRGEIVGIAAAPVAFTDAQLATRFRFTVSTGMTTRPPESTANTTGTASTPRSGCTVASTP